MSITLKIGFADKGNQKTMRFTSEMSVSEACEQIHGKTEEGGEDHGLFLPAVEGKTPAKWLLPDRTLQFYDLQTDTVLMYKKRHNKRKVQMLDETTKTIYLDESRSVQECVEVIGSKIGINNPEEYALQKKGTTEWIKATAILGEVGLEDDDILMLKKKFHYNDANIDRNDPVQLLLLYIQCRDSVVEGKYPTTKQEAVELAAIQCQITLGDHKPSFVSSSLNLKEYMAPQWHKVKGIDKDITKEYRKFVGLSDVNAKYRYVQLCRSLKTYGITVYTVKTRDPVKKNKLKDIIIGVTRESVMFMDAITQEVDKSYKLTQIKRWAAADKSITFDLGDYEPDYLTIYSQQSEAIAQLISGYIEIILRARRDAGKIVADRDGLVASEERVPVNRAAVSRGVTTTTSGGGTTMTAPQYGQVGGSRAASGIPASQQVAINDLQSAVRATDLLLLELDEAANAPKQPLSAGMSVTTLTAQQYRQQLMTNAQNAAMLAMGMLDDFNNPPEGGMQALRSQLTSKAQQIMSSMAIVGKNAQNAAYVPDVSDQAMDIMDASKRLANALGKMMKLASSAADGNEADRLAMAQAAYTAAATSMLMTTACESGNVGASSRLLVEEAAKAVGVCGKLLIDYSTQQADLADDHLIDEIKGAVSQYTLANEQLTITCEILAGVCANPDASKKIAGTCDLAAQQARAITSAFRKTTTLPSSLIDALTARAQDLLSAIDMLTSTIDCAQPNAKQEGEEELIGDVSEEFSLASANLTQALASLKNAGGDVMLMQESVKQTSGATNRLVLCCRTVAGKADPATQNRLLQAAKASLDAINNLTNSCKVAIKNPEDTQAFEKLLETAGQLQSISQQMVADAGKIASVNALCDTAKTMAAYVSSLTAGIRGACVDLPDALSTPALKSTKEVAESMPRLLTAVKRVIQNPMSDKAQVDLLEMAQRTSLPPMNLVNAAKRLAPKVTDANNKQRMVYAADNTAQSVHKLMAACQTYKQIGGHIEIEEALEAFAATISDLETAEIAAAGGFLEILQGQSRENTIELLSMAMKSMHAANQDLTTVARSDPAQLGNAVKNTTNVASQVAMAAKGVASTTPAKAGQKKILAAAKQFASQMEQLIRAARTVASSPNDPSADLLLDSSMQDITATLANLMGSSVHIDSRELDEASTLILTEATKLKALNATNPGNYQQHVEEIEGIMKAVSAAVMQVTGMARNKNIKGLGAAAKITAATIPTLVAAANNAAGSTDNENMQEAIISSTNALVHHIVSLFDFAKARVANTKDPVYDLNLTQGTKTITDAITKLQRSLGSAANKDCEEAVDKIMAAQASLDANIIQELATLSASSPEELIMISQGALQQLGTNARSLGGTSSLIMSSASFSNGLLGSHSLSAAEAIVHMVAAANKVFCAAACSVAPSVFIPAKNILDAAALLLSAGGNIPQIINSARTVSTSTQQLLLAAKERAATYEGKEDQKERLLQTSQRVANCTTNLAKAAKALAAKQPDAADLMKAAVAELEGSTKAVLIAASYPAESGVSPEHFDKLISGSRNVATSSSHLISTSMSVSSKPKDPALQSALSDAASSLTNSIKDLLRSGAGMMPGVVECEEAIETSQKASSELTSAALAIAVGSFDMTLGKGIPHQKSQEDLVEAARSIGLALSQLARASRQSPEAIGRSAKFTANLLPQLVHAAKVSVATTNDTDAQNSAVEQSKRLVDSILRLAQASARASGNPTSETYSDVMHQVETAEATIGQLVSALASDVNLLRDLDDAVMRISKAAATLDVPTKPDPAFTYQECKDDLTSKSKNLAMVIKNIVGVDKSNIVLLTNSAKEIAEMIPSVLEIAQRTSALASDPSVRSQIIASSKSLANASVDILKDSKNAASDKLNPTYQQNIGNHFKTATTAIGNLLSSAKQGAVGEIMADKAVDGISRAISDIEAFSLFAAAGQLDDDDGVKKASPVQAQKDMFNAAKALVIASSQFVGSTKGTQEQLGAAAAAVSETVLRVVKNSKDFATALNDATVQQEVLASSKAAGIASQQLVLAGKDAQRFKKDPTAARSLSKAAEGLAESIGVLVTNAHNALAEAQKGTREMDSTHAKISGMLDQFATLPANEAATAMEVAAAARSVADTSLSMVSAYNASNQDDLVKASGQVYASTAKLLSNTKGASRLLTDDPSKHRFVDKSKEVASAMLSLIQALKDQAPKNISSASDAIAVAIQTVVKASKALPGGASITVEEDEEEVDQIGEDLEETAEKELLSAAKKIEEAAAALLAAKPKPKPKAPGVLIDSNDVAATIVDASSTIAQAVARLVAAAAVAQGKRRELKAQQGKNYRRDPTWSNGLISAARAVAEATHGLVGSAHKAVQGKAEEEELIATAKAVAAATAQLVTASRAKAADDASSQQSHTQLSAAAKAVAMATSQLVAAAKAATAFQEQEAEQAPEEDFNFTGSKVKELEQQMKILKLEKELETARRQMLNSRKQKYAAKE